MFVHVNWLIVGKVSADFTTRESAWRSMLRTSLGEAENFYPEILESIPDIGPVVVVLYQVLGIVLLLNVLIAIFLEVRSGSGEERELYSAAVGMS